MCGIVGSNQTDFEYSKIVDTLKHRGVDNQAFVQQNNLFLGHTRLSIIDLDNEANQPMTFDSITLVFNGEIYNYQELIQEHKLTCQTKSDSEVLIRLYQKYGTDFLNILEGMFAFCLYDAEKALFFCARDRFGKKPFYYFRDENKFYFASEIKAIIAMLGYTPPFHKQALFEYLVYQTPLIPNTFYQGIRKLPAANMLIYHKNNLELNRYYHFNNLPTKYDDTNQILSDVESRLLQAVKKRLVADVDIAVLLSGGLDSSLVSALYKKLSPNELHTFSIGYNTHKRYCEISHAKRVSQLLKSQHHEIIIDKELYLSTINNVLEHLDEPMADSAAIPTYILSKEIHKQGFKVCLSGEGSDEIFMGYDPYYEILTKEQDNQEYIYHSRSHTFTQEQFQELFAKYTTYPQHKISSSYDLTNTLSYIDISLWIAEVLMSKVDRMSMAHSVELRAPFLDHHLIEYLLQVDSKTKLGKTTKTLLKTIAEKYIDKETIYRRKKGFSSPFIEWLYEAYNTKILELFLEVNKELNLFKNSYLEYLFNEGKNGRYKQHIYSLFLFCKWYKRNYING